jgi:hypothetical protein
MTFSYLGLEYELDGRRCRISDPFEFEIAVSCSDAS